MGFIDDFKKVINEGIKKSEFTTHDFIKKYSSDEFFERRYIDTIIKKSEKHETRVFKEVHTIYGGTLKNRQDELGIEFIGKSLSTDMFGRRHKVARYRKLTGQELEDALERGKEVAARYEKKRELKLAGRARRAAAEKRKAEREAAEAEAQGVTAETSPTAEFQKVESLKPEPKPKVAPAPKPTPKPKKVVEKPKELSFEEKKAKALREAEKANEELAKMLKAKGLI